MLFSAFGEAGHPEQDEADTCARRNHWSGYERLTSWFLETEMNCFEEIEVHQQRFVEEKIHKIPTSKLQTTNAGKAQPL